MVEMTTITTRIIHLLALGFGTGLARRMPGTVGSLVGIVFYLGLADLPLVWYIISTLVLFILGIWLCGRTARDFGVHDHQSIVWDEIVGYLVTMTAAPAGWGWIAVGFVLFRLFDIWKPWPIRVLDRRVGGGFGIMADDLLAGIYAAVLIQITSIFLWT